MFARLLESRKNRKRSVWGALLSTVAHTAAIALAIFATAQARVDDPSPVDVVRWVTPPVARPAAPAKPIATRQSVDRPVSTPAPLPLVVDRIDVGIPSVDLSPSLPAPAPAPLSGEGISTAPSRDSLGGTASSEPYSGDQVERQVFLRPGSSPPRYPASLRAAGVEGQVVVLFVVSEAGRVEPGTIRFTASDNPLFEAAVRSALHGMRFIPADVGGRKVRQLVQMPFVFTLTR